jgi:hypothetical protein
MDTAQRSGASFSHGLRNRRVPRPQGPGQVAPQGRDPPNSPRLEVNRPKDSKQQLTISDNNWIPGRATESVKRVSKIRNFTVGW